MLSSQGVELFDGNGRIRGCGLVGGRVSPGRWVLRFPKVRAKPRLFLLPEDQDVELSTASPALCLPAVTLSAVTIMDYASELCKQTPN